MSVQPRIRWFGQEERDKIVEEAIDILERIGVFVENDEAIELLDGAGAQVVASTGRILIPAPLIESALRSTPERIQVFDRFGEMTMDLGEDRVHFNPGSAALRVFDYALGKARMSSPSPDSRMPCPTTPLKAPVSFQATSRRILPTAIACTSVCSRRRSRSLPEPSRSERSG